MDNAIAQISKAPKPCLVHCNVGFTAAISVMVFAAKENKVSASEVMKWGMDFGFNYAEQARLYNFLKQYLD